MRRRQLENETATHLGAAEILSSENRGKRIGDIESAKDIREATSLKWSNPREEVDMATWQQQIPEVTEALQKQRLQGKKVCPVGYQEFHRIIVKMMQDAGRMWDLFVLVRELI